MLALGHKLGIPLPSTAENLDIASKEKTLPEEDVLAQLDQQGQMQYIGKNSSFLFHLKLRNIVQHTFSQNKFVLFGHNAAHGVSSRPKEPGQISYPTIEQFTMSDHFLTPDTDPTTLDVLLGAFFDTIHPDFPVLHEASFRETYETCWSLPPHAIDRAWNSSLLCVFLLASRIAPLQISSAQEVMWWSQLQNLLPSVFFTSSVTAIQALLLASLHLHHTNHRDACWTLTGAAVRIAFAIGLHQDSVRTMQTPTIRELRKQLWWVLYDFEQMQVSSHDRPSAIDDNIYSVGSPQLAMTGVAGHNPPDYFHWFGLLVRMMARASQVTCDEGHALDKGNPSQLGPLSPTARLLRDLARWEDTLPHYLSLKSMDEQPQQFKRALLLLHAKKHYISTLICRNALLSRAMGLFKDPSRSSTATMSSMAIACIESGRHLSMILLKLDDLAAFNSITWWDCFYAFSSSLILLLDVVCSAIDKCEEIPESGGLLQRLAALMARQLKNPLMPGTLRKWAEIVTELNAIAMKFESGRERAPDTSFQERDSSGLGPEYFPNLFENGYLNSFPICNDKKQYQHPTNNEKMADLWHGMDWDELGAMIVTNDTHMPS